MMRIQRTLIAAILSLTAISSAMAGIGAGRVAPPPGGFRDNKLPAQLEHVGIEEHLGAQVELGLTFRDESGAIVPLRTVVNGRKPTLLLLGYYGCPNLCNYFYNGATDSLKNFEWTPGKEFNVLSLSVDPRETPQLATRKKQNHVAAYGRSDAASGWSWWVNDHAADAEATDVNVKRLATQVGWNYKFDKEQNQYAHSAAAVVLTPSGKVSRYLYGIEFQPKDLRLALVEAGGSKIGTVVDHILLYCYNYDPKTRKYSLYATNVMRAGGGVTVLLVGGILAMNIARSRRRKNLKTNT
jgi:protein SCO1/2